MLLQIQVYPAIEVISNTNSTQPQSPQQSIEPLVTHYINTSIPVTNNDSTSSSSNGTTTELLWSVGRKQGDYHITTDRSVSREHLRILKLEGIRNSNNDDHGSMNNVLLQIQNVGKLGSSLVIEESFTDDDDDDDGDKDGNIVNKNDDDGNDSDTTVDESLLSHRIKIGSSNLNSGSHIHRSQNQRASQQSIIDDVDLSSITKHLTQRALINITTTPRRKYNVRLQSLGLNETLTVGLYGDSSNTNNNTSSAMTVCDYHHPNRIIVQCGKLGTTIVMTRIQLRFVASRIPMKQFLVKMKSDIVTILGGTIEETLYHPNENNNEDCETNRTYLISSEYHGSPKHIIAWCRNIPIVRPSFVASLIDEYRNKLFKSLHVCCTNDASPLPNMGFIQQHALPVPKKDWKFFEGTHDAELWVRCTLISPLSDTDPTDGDSASGGSNLNIHQRNEKELNELVQAAGATVITMQSLLKEDDNLLRQVAILDYNSINGSTIRHLLNGAFADHPTTTTYFTLDTPLMKSQYPMALKMLQDIYGIPTLTTKEVAVAITEQRNIHDQICSFHKNHLKPKTANENIVQEPSSTNTMDKSLTTESNEIEMSMEIDDVSDTRSRKQRAVQPASTRPKRTRGGSSITTQDVVDTHRTTVSKTPIRQNLNNDHKATRVTSNRNRRQPMAPNDVLLNENANEPDVSFMVNCDDAPPEDAVVHDLDSPPTNLVEAETAKCQIVITNVSKMDGNNGEEQLRRKQVTDNTEGWFTAMPQGPTRKSVYNEKIKKLTSSNKAEDVNDNDGEKIMCFEPAMTQTLKGMVVEPKDAATHLHRIQHAGPNYKAFRKNTVHLPTIATIVGLKACRPTKTRKVVSMDSDERRSQVEAQQRRADELFR